MRCVAVLLSCLMLGGCAVTVSEADFLHPGRVPWAAQEPAPFTVERLEVRHADGNTSRGVWARSPGARMTVFFIQGNDEIVDLQGAMRLWQYQYIPADVVVVDRRGYGQTPGRPDVRNLMADALDVFDTVRARTAGPVVVHGFSLGTTVAAGVARARPVDALVLEGAIPSVPEYLATVTPWYLAPFLRYQPTEPIRDIDLARDLAAFGGPILIAVGEKDPQTPAALSRSLHAQLAGRNARLEVVPGAGHYALTQAAGFEVLRGFLQQVGR